MAEHTYAVELHVNGYEPIDVDVRLESADDLPRWLDDMPTWMPFYIDKFAINRTRIEAKFPLLVRREAITSAEIKYDKGPWSDGADPRAIIAADQASQRDG